MGKIYVGLVGVSGYTGMELLRLLANHPHMQLQVATSRQEAGKKLQELYPALQDTSLGQLVVTRPDVKKLAEQCSLVFLAVPHGTAMDLAHNLLEAGVKVVDLSADFRLKDKDVYGQWYELRHRHPQLLAEAVYGLPELYAPRIREAWLVANPGCYPTSVILGLYPGLESGLINPSGIIIDSKSGTSGAGRKASVGTLFCEVYDNFRPYGIGKHRHTPEMEQELALAAQTAVSLIFCPHLLPINRGILSSIYCTLLREIPFEELYKTYKDFYALSPWVRILPPGQLPETRWVRDSMFCDIGLIFAPRTQKLVILSAIDNLCRGAAGQALANANLMSGLDIRCGLNVM